MAADNLVMLSPSTACGRSPLPEEAEERINQADPPGLSGFYFCLPIDNCVYCVYTVYIECAQFDYKEYSQMEIYLSNSGQEPIYAQITRQIKQQILSGQLHEGDSLPSIRLLAKELRISVITTKRAYEDLEAEGFLVTQPGRGSFVAPQNPALLHEQHLKKVEDCLQGAVDAARLGGIGYEEVAETLRLLWEG